MMRQGNNIVHDGHCAFFRGQECNCYLRQPEDVELLWRGIVNALVYAVPCWAVIVGLLWWRWHQLGGGR